MLKDAIIRLKESKLTLNLFAILSILVLSFFLFHDRFDLLLMEDELYHVKDIVKSDWLSAINPFGVKYDFLGHPPLYRISLVFWFSLFNLTSYSAHLHAFFFSTITLIMFFYCIREHTRYTVALLSTLSLVTISGISNYFVECQADMPAMFIYFLSLYFISREYSWRAGLSILFLVLMRESAIALSFAICLLPFFIKSSKWKFAKCLKITSYSLIALSTFFSVNILLKGKFSNHPFLLDNLSHLNEEITFFSLTEQKIASLVKVINIFDNSIGIVVGVIFLVSLLIVSIMWKRVDRSLKEMFFLKAIYCICFFLFFLFFEDSIERDFLPIYFFIIFTIFTSISLLKKRAIKVISIFITVVLFCISDTYYRVDYLEQKEKVIRQSVDYVENNLQSKKICFMWPIDYARDTVHGYFNKDLELECSHDTEVIVVNSFQNNNILKKQYERVEKLKLKLLLRSDVNRSYDSWYEIYN